MAGAVGAGRLTDDPHRADRVILVPATRPMFHWYGRHLCADQVVTANLERCFVLETSDSPADYLRGAYAAMPSGRYSPARHRAIGYLRRPNAQADAVAARPSTSRLLFSFAGAESHPLRGRLVRQFGDLPDAQMELTGRWSNYSGDEEASYWKLLTESRFVLCPRGLGTGSIRVQETMQAGRVPVIISDGWIPPAGPDWDGFSITVEESAIGEIPDILAAREGDAAEMGGIGRAEWERFFRPEDRFGRWLLELVDEIAAEKVDWDTAAEIERWRSRGFRWTHGFDPFHRTMAKAERAVRRRIGRVYPPKGSAVREQP